QGLLDDLHSGEVWVDWIGHGSIRSWAQEQVFTTASVPTLGNADRPALFVTMTCSNGVFQFPNTGPTGASQRGLAEVATLAPNGGAIAFWAPTNPALPDALPVLNESVLQAALGGRVKTLGDATRQAKLATDVSLPGAWD